VAYVSYGGGEGTSAPRRRPITDILAALYAAFSVTLALLARQRTKSGQRVDVSLFESGVSAVSQWITIYNLTGATVRRFGNSYPSSHRTNSLRRRTDRSSSPWVTMSYGRSCAASSRGRTHRRPSISSNLDRIIPANRETLTGILQKALKKRTSDSWVSALKDVGIPTE